MSTVSTVRRVSNPNPSAPRGGQASGAGLFGLPGNGDFARRRVSASSSPTPAPVATPAKVRGEDDRARKVGGLTAGQRRARVDAWVDFAARTAPASNVAGVPAPCMETLLAKYRSMEARHEEGEAVVTPKPTPHMLACAAASDAREAFPFHHDEEEAAEGAFHAAGAGRFEATLAMEGC